MGKGGGWWYVEAAAGPGKRSCTKSESKNSRTQVGRQKEGSEAESLRSLGMWAFLVGHKLPFCLSSSSRRPMRLASRIDKTPVWDHNIHDPVIESGRYLLSFVSELKIHHIPRPRLFSGHLCVTCSMGLNSQALSGT